MERGLLPGQLGESRNVALRKQSRLKGLYANFKLLTSKYFYFLKPKKKLYAFKKFPNALFRITIKMLVT
jgi:hypothetical protein